MGEANRASVQLFFSDNGDTITAFESLEIRDTFTDPLGSYDFVLRPTRPKIARYREALQKGRRISWTVNARPQADCLIQTVAIHVDPNGGVVFRVHCESLLATAFQASVDPDIAKHFQSDTPVTTVVLEALAKYGPRPDGFTTIIGDGAASRAAMSGKPIGGAKAAIEVAELKARDCQAQEGEMAYAFCARIFTRLGVALRVNEKGELLLDAPDYEQGPRYTLVQDFTGARRGNRMLDLSIEDTNSDQFSECVVRGVQADVAGQTRAAQPIARVGVAGVESIGTELFSTTKRVEADFGGHTFASDVTPYKPKIIRDKNARDAKRCESRAKLAMGWLARRSYVLTCTVDGFVSNEGAIWTMGTIASVQADVDNINEPMWILERAFILDVSGGQRTRLKLIPKGALVLGGDQQ